MAKFKKKSDEFDAELFDKTRPQNTWPENVRENEISPTGYSVGTLERVEIQIPNNHEPGIMIDGFIVLDMHYILTDHTGKQSQMSIEDFENEFMLL